MQANRMIASELNALNHEMHSVAEWMRVDDWLRRGAPSTNLPAFTFWHIPRVLDSTIQMGIRGVPELIASEPWASRTWARDELGTGYTLEEADTLAAQVVPAEVLEYADAIRSQASLWLRAATDDDLDARNKITEHTRQAPAYSRPEVQKAVANEADWPVWLVLSITCFAHGWAHLEEIRLLARAGRQTSR